MPRPLIELVHSHDFSHQFFGVRFIRSNGDTVPQSCMIGDLITRLTIINEFETGATSAHLWIVGGCELCPLARTLKFKFPGAILDVGEVVHACHSTAHEKTRHEGGDIFRGQAFD